MSGILDQVRIRMEALKETGKVIRPNNPIDEDSGDDYSSDPSFD